MSRNRRRNGQSKQSKFKNATINQTAYHNWYHDISVIDEDPVYGSFLSATSQYVAHCSNTSSIAVYPLKFFEKNNNLGYNPDTSSNDFKTRSPTQFISHLGSGSIRGIVFSHHEAYSQPVYETLTVNDGMKEFKQSDSEPMIGSFSGDKVVVQKLQPSFDFRKQQFNLEAETVLNEDTQNATSVTFNRACHNILTVTDNDTVKLYDLEKRTKFQNIGGSNSTLCAFDWIKEGVNKTAILSNESASLYFADCRSNKLIKQCDNCYSGAGYIDVKSTKNWLVTVGFEKTRSKVLKMWDERNMKEELFHMTVDKDPGKLFLNYDFDSDLFHLISKSDTQLHVVDASESSKAVINSVSKTPVSRKQLLSACLVPKPALDIYSCEVNRVLLLNKDSVESIRIEVLRRRRNMFFPELFPDTVDPIESAFEVAGWLANDSVAVKKTNVELLYKIKNGMHAREQTEKKIIKKQQQAKEVKQKRELESLRQQEMKKKQVVYKKNTKMIGYIPKYKNIIAETSTKKDSYYGLKDISEDLFAANEKFFAATKKYSNDIYIRELSNKGKVEHPPLAANILSGHKSKVSCLLFDRFEVNTLLSGSVDGSIRVWTNKTCIRNYTLHSNSVNFIMCHPTVKGLIFSSSTAHDFCLFDINSQNGENLFVKDSVYNSLVQSKLNSACFDYFGGHLLILTDTNDIILLQLKSAGNKVKLIEKSRVNSGLSNSGAADIQCLSKDGLFIVSGFAPKTGQRVAKAVGINNNALQVAKPQKLSKGSGLCVPHPVLESNTVFFTAKGEKLVQVFEVTVDFNKTTRKKTVNFHRCSEVATTSEAAPLVSVALPFRCNNTNAFEVGNLVQFSGSRVEVLKLKIPKGEKVKDVFADDLYPDNTTLSAEPVYPDIKRFLSALQTNKLQEPEVIKTLNLDNKPLYSNRVKEIQQERTTNVLKSRSRVVREQQLREEQEKETNNNMMNRLTQIAKKKRDYQDKRQEDTLGLDSDDEWSDS